VFFVQRTVTVVVWSTLPPSGSTAPNAEVDGAHRALRLHVRGDLERRGRRGSDRVRQRARRETGCERCAARVSKHGDGIHPTLSAIDGGGANACDA
jgi:hypothetical protein